MRHSQSRPVALCVLLLGGLLATAVPARADDFVYPGAQPKLGAGAGQTLSRGSSAIFYNPANLIYSKFIQPDLDVSFAKVTYTYQQVDTDKYDPVVVNVTAPPVTAGLSFRPVPSFSVGISFLPTGTGNDQEVPNVPLELTSGAYQVMDVSTKQTGYKIAAGAAFRFAFPFTAGVGIIHASEKTQTIITESGKTDPFIDALYAANSNRFVLGMRSELFDRAFVAALTYKTAVTKNYQGDILINLDPATSDYQVFTGVGYEPAVIGLGLEARFGVTGVYFDMVHKSWSGGRSVVKQGFGIDPLEVDLVDTNSFVVGGKVWIAGKHMLTGAFGLVPSNIGTGTEEAAGTASGLDDGTSQAIGGVSFGNFDAIPRQIFSGGYRYKLTGNGSLELGGSYQSGTRVVPDGYNQAGTYTLSVIMLTAGLAYGF